MTQNVNDNIQQLVFGEILLKLFLQTDESVSYHMNYSRNIVCTISFVLYSKYDN